MEFCDDNQLAYEEYRTEFVEDCGLVFDDAYRLAHLPLVAPDHPLVIPSKPGSNYLRGVHDWVYSIALPISINELRSSKAFLTLLDELRASSFANKISWDTFSQRQDKLHATVCGGLSTGQAPHIERATYQQLSKLGPVSIRVRGLFSGNINIGRLYLKVYPELRDGRNILHTIQTLFGSPITNLHLVGLFNFVEELNTSETQDLHSMLVHWWDVDIMIAPLDNLWLLKSKDDLVLNGGVEKLISLR